MYLSNLKDSAKNLLSLSLKKTTNEKLTTNSFMPNTVHISLQNG